MFQDFVFGLKVLLKQRGFTIAAVLTLALCIGANTAIFTVVEGVILRPLPYPEPDRLVTMYNVYPGIGVERGANGVPDYLDRRKLTDVFSSVALIGYNRYDLGLDGAPQSLEGRYVTPSYFTVLARQPLLGRTFTEEEAVLGKEKVVILTEGLWKEQFAADRNVIGRDIRLSGSLYRIVGVMPESFNGMDNENRLWVPFAFRKEQTSDDARHSNNWGMIARLKKGVTLAQAQERIDDLNRRNLDIFPQLKSLIINARFGTRVVGLKDEMVRDIRPTLYLLQIAVGVVLLIGCVNLANLLLVRSNARMKELAIRFSLGAGRWRITRQLLTESLMLAAVGGALGAAVGYAGVRLLTRLGTAELPRGESIGINASVLAFTAAIAVITGIAFGCVPLIHVLRSDLNEIFRGNERAGTSGRAASWVRSGLVVCQFAFAFVLLIGAGLLTLSFSRLMKVEPGFKPQGAVTARYALPRVRYGEDVQARNFQVALLERVRAIPGVQQAGLTNFLPFSGNSNASVISIAGRPLGPGENPPVPGWNHASPSYFAAMGIRMLQGRDFSEADGPDSPKVIIIDEFLAKKYWPKGDAIGAKINRGIQVGNNPKPDECTIIGVVASVKTGDLAEENPVGQIYFSYKQYTPRAAHLVLRTASGDPSVLNAVRRELQRGDPELPLFDTRTMPERLSRSLAPRRAAMALCLVFAGLALLLAAIGVYGVLAYSVSQRTREFGIRAALGAESGDVLRMVIGHGLKMSAMGLAIGVAGAMAVTRLMASMLYHVRPSDPTVFVAVAITLAVVACAASLIPSARAVRIPPATALRYE